MCVGLRVKPLPLMDVDGPLNPFDAPWHIERRPPQEYELHELSLPGEPTYRVAIGPGHGLRLTAMSQSFDLAWATVWGSGTNRLISPLLGLPENLPIVPLIRPRVFQARRSWETEQIAAWVEGRPFAWFDDEINRATRDWLARSSSLGAHFALRVPSHEGLTEADFDQLDAFAAGLADADRNGALR